MSAAIVSSRGQGRTEDRVVRPVHGRQDNQRIKGEADEETEIDDFSEDESVADRALLPSSVGSRAIRLTQHQLIPREQLICTHGTATLTALPENQRTE